MADKPDVVIPDRLASGAGAHWPNWLAALPDRIAEIAQQWDVHCAAPFLPGGETAWVAPGVDGRGRDVVVKIAPRLIESRDEAVGLRALGTNWATTVFAELTDGPLMTEDDVDGTALQALLVERILPGTSLAECLPEPERDEVVATFLRATWSVEPPKVLRPLVELTELWSAEFDAALAASKSGLGKLESGVARAGVELFRELGRGTDDPAMLCTDLHAENVLADSSHPRAWRLIDPKPYVGDRCYDALQHMLNCERLHQDPVGLIDRLASMLDLDPRRLRQWMFARGVIESQWSDRYVGVVETLAETV